MSSAAALLALALTVASASAGRLVGYYNANPNSFGVPDPAVTWAAQPYDTIILGFLMNTPDGSCTSADPEHSLLSLGNLKDGSVAWGDCKGSWKVQNGAFFAAQQAQRGVKIMLAVGGGAGYYSQVWQAIGQDVDGFVARIRATITKIEASNGFVVDGIDLDYEDNDALGYGPVTPQYDGVDLVVRLSKALTALRGGGGGGGSGQASGALGGTGTPGRFLLSHAPQGMFLCSKKAIAACGDAACVVPGDGASTPHCPCAAACGAGTRAYIEIMARAGAGVIDFLNVQYYNTRHIGSVDFAVGELTALHEEGDVDTGALLFGKPSCLNVTSKSAGFVAKCANYGYLEPSAAAAAVRAVVAAGVPLGGAMTWQLANEWAYFNGSFAMGNALKAALPPTSEALMLVPE